MTQENPCVVNYFSKNSGCFIVGDIDVVQIRYEQRNVFGFTIVTSLLDPSNMRLT